MNDDTSFEKAITAIRRRLEAREDYHPRAFDPPLFGGADVIIDEVEMPHHPSFLANQPLVLDKSGYQALRRVVITKNARALSSLFYQFRDSGFDEIDSLTKYGFYGTLAQAALDYIGRHGDPDDPFPMLERVFDAGASFLRKARAGRQG